MPFNFQTFFDRRGIEYVESGPNVASGNINIQCPFCGAADPSHHMGVNLQTSVWGCWRNKKHRGRQPQRLIMRLLRCDYDQANTIVGEAPRAELSKFESAISKLKETGGNSAPPLSLSLLAEFTPITWENLGRRFANYLVRKRGFRGQDIADLSAYYNLQYSLMGFWANRIIMPVYMEQGLVTWTARAIEPNAYLRYDTLTTKPDKAAEQGNPVAAMNIKHTLYNYADLLKDNRRGKMLFVHEGPMDALKTDFYGYPLAVRATCLFSMDVTEEQRLLLGVLAQHYEHKFLLLDTKAMADGSYLRTLEGISQFGFKKGRMPDGFKDPGELKPNDVRALIQLNS